MGLRKSALTLNDVTLPKDYDMKRDGITQSLLSIFPLCRMKFLLKINRWKLPDDDFFTAFGNISHDVLEWAYSKKKMPTKSTIKRLVTRSVKKWEKILGTQALMELPNTAAKAEIVLWEYFQYYRKDFKQMKFVELERVFKTKFHGFKLMGKKDGIIQRKGRTLLEHKTKSRIKEDLLNGVLNFDFQNMFYIVSDKLDNKKKINKALYNIIRNPGLRQGAKEDFGDFLNRIKKDILERPTHYFVRYDVSYLDKDIEIFKLELKAKLEDTENFLKGKLQLYRNQNACEIPYRCEFLAACGSGSLRGYVQGKTLFPELEG